MIGSWDCVHVFNDILQDLKREFVTELIYPAVQANCIYEVSDSLTRKICTNDLLNVLQNVYLLGTSLARPVIARGMIAIADKEGCKCVQISFIPYIRQ